jgi:mono/diheme cytochrome c family protein
MSDENNETKVHGVFAEYTSVDTLLAACNRIREAGYEKTDAFTPFAVHGIDKALGIKPTKLPWIALGGGLTGAITALAMQIWMNSINYPYIISGKPYISLPAFIPVAFELTVLFASFGAFFGMWALNRLPKFSNPMFTDPRFDRATDDRFFLYIDSKDQRYDQQGVQQLLAETGSDYIKPVVEDDSSPVVPKGFFVLVGVLAALSIVPLLIVAKMRVTNSSSPRFHVFYDMDFSPAKDAQQVSTLFADGRAMRPDVPGTVARGELEEDLNFLTGIDIDQLSRIDLPRAQRLVHAHAFALQDSSPQSETSGDGDDDGEKEAEEDKSSEGDDDPGQSEPPSDSQPAADSEPPANAQPEPSAATAKSSDEADTPDPKQPAEKSEAVEQAAATEPTAVSATEPAPAAAQAAPPSVMDTTPWLKDNPLDVDEELVRTGQKYFGIYCSVCHGLDGGGNGLVNQRAKKILAANWIPPSPLHQETLYSDQYPDGKLFNTISNGIRKMPGYAGQISPANRWAIVAYVRALQRSRNAVIDSVPADQREEIKSLQAEVEQKLAEEAEAEQRKEQERAAKAAGA